MLMPKCVFEGNKI